MSNVCEHGSLKRKCEICELHELESRYDSLLSDFLLMQKRAQTAEAKVARLREAIERAPHGRECPVIMTESLCDCWKAEALKEVQREA